LAPRPGHAAGWAKVSFPKDRLEVGDRPRARTQILQDLAERRQALLGAVNSPVAVRDVVKAVLPVVQVPRRRLERISGPADPPDAGRQAQLAPPPNVRAVLITVRKSSQELAYRMT